METAHFETINAALASKYLESNTDNRRNRKWWSTALSAAMTRGEWVTTHQGIAFDVTGRLIDGQHRLEAIVQSNQPIRMLVTRNLSEKAFSVLDSGMKRTIADQTKMHARTAETCRFIAGIVWGRNGCTAAQATQIYHAGVGPLHDQLISYCPTNRAMFTAAGIRSVAVVMMLDGYQQQYIMDLYSNLVYQKFDALPPIAHSFIRQLQNKKISNTNKYEIVGRAIKIFNPEYSKVERLILTESEMEAAYEYIRSVIRRNLDKESNDE
jgi:hypothetical protein